MTTYFEKMNEKYICEETWNGRRRSNGDQVQTCRAGWKMLRLTVFLKGNLIPKYRAFADFAYAVTNKPMMVIVTWIANHIARFRVLSDIHANAKATKNCTKAKL